jgi:uncharacterized protein (DUF427 family)
VVPVPAGELVRRRGIVIGSLASVRRQIDGDVLRDVAGVSWKIAGRPPKIRARITRRRRLGLEIAVARRWDIAGARKKVRWKTAIANVLAALKHHEREVAAMSDNHPITISKASGRVVVTWRGRAIVDTASALVLKEHVYPEVYYVPRADADMSVFERTTRETTCPYKGVAHYFSLRSGEDLDANAVWTYETPKQGVAEIKEYLAFYPDKVEITTAKA